MASLDGIEPQPLLRGWRALIVSGALLAVLVVLTFADRAPRYTVDRAPELTELGRRVEDRTGIDLLDRSDVPFQVDDIGHFALWAVVGVIAFAVFDARNWPSFLGGQPVGKRAVLMMLLVLAMLFELGQAVLTSTRNLSVSDGVANLIGASVGLAFAWAGMRLWRRWRLRSA